MLKSKKQFQTWSFQTGKLDLQLSMFNIILFSKDALQLSGAMKSLNKKQQLVALRN